MRNRRLLPPPKSAERGLQFAATTSGHGLYNTQQFVLRLSPVIHRILRSLGPGITTNGKAGLDGVKAMSTYLHETIHWWQHIGSTYGFISSLNYPVQSHATHFDLKQLVDLDGFKKSVHHQAIQLNQRGPMGYGTAAGLANKIVNNHFDLLAYRAFTLGPAAARDVIENKLFEAVGHAFHITYGLTVGILAATIDRDFRTLPHPREWEEGFRELTARKVEGYYYGSPVGLWPLGSYEIFEGQARFSQIQFLSHSCGHRFDWDDFRYLGMLDGVYIEAFEHFLRLTESIWPERVNDPLVSLFLLVCDLAINPGRGFPFSVTPNYESFIDDVNPGARFVFFSRLIALKFPTMRGAVRRHSRDEYVSLSTELCLAAREFPTMLMLDTFSKWFSQGGPLSGLRREYETYDFRPENYVIRHLLAHFLSFQEDKYKSPEFFCWPGAWTAGDGLSEGQLQLFEKHGALFVDKEDDDSVFARFQPNRDDAVIQKTFNEFYHNMVLFDLTNQWIIAGGPFRYDIAWLAANKSREETKIFLRDQFHAAFNLDPEAVELIAA